MEYTSTLPAATQTQRRLTARINGSAVSAWTLGFAPVTYLALRDGGYDTIVRSEVGSAVWWIVLLGALAGVLPGRLGRTGWTAIGLLGLFTLWTGLGTSWSVSPGDTITELGREAAYLGFLVLALALQGRTSGRHTVNGLACAVGLVTGLAVLSRLHPEWFPANVDLRVFGATAGRKLSYPLNYWNALAAFAAIGVPLFVTVALTARSVLARAAAAAVLPLSALCIYLTLSRGGVLEVGVAVAVLLALVPRRLQALGTVAAGTAGAAILLVAAANHPAMRSGMRTPAALHQGAEMLALAVVVCVGVGLLQAAMATAEMHLVAPRWARPDRRTTRRATLIVAGLAVLVAIVVGVPDHLAHLWHQFAAPGSAAVPADQSTVFSRFSAVNGNGRYQYWQAAMHAAGAHPITGVGPGTFQYLWAQHATTDGSVINAHSLYFETLAETGVVGIVLIAGLLLVFLWAALRRAFSPSTPLATRFWIAGAAAGLAAFMTAAALEWVWQLAALAAAALILGAVLIAARDDDAGDQEQPPPTRPRWAARAALGAIAAVAVIAIAVPWATAVKLGDSQRAALSGNLVGAYQDSLTAEQIEPYAVAPRLQEALVLEQAGDLGAAAAAARVATQKATRDWEAWLTLARIDARRGSTGPALAAFRRAESLDPRNPLWQEQA